MPSQGGLITDGMRQVRNDLDEMRRDVDRLRVPQMDNAEAVLVKTATKDTYPTVAGAWYYCEIQRVTGRPVEGTAGTVGGVGRFIYAYNVGPAIPPSGTLMVATLSRGQYTINYCTASS